MLPSGCCLRRMVVLWGHRMLARGFSPWSLELLKEERTEEHQLDGELESLRLGREAFSWMGSSKLKHLKGVLWFLKVWCLGCVFPGLPGMWICPECFLWGKA